MVADCDQVLKIPLFLQEKSGYGVDIARMEEKKWMWTEVGMELV